jgi:hypothetical protein
MSKFFVDAFDHIKESTPKPRHQEESVKIKYSDQRTGAEYIIEEHKPNGPQGDFRVSKNSSDMQWRSVMGLGAQNFDRPDNVDQAFEDERLKPEPIVSEKEIEDFVRQRESADTKRSMAQMPTREPVYQEAEDRGEYTLNFKGQVQDKPKNVVGLFGTEEKRPEPMPLGRIENKVRVEPKPVKNEIKKSDMPSFELSAKASKIQELLSNTFRSIFASKPQDQNEKSIDDRRLGTEQKNLSKVIYDSGLLKPWVPPTVHGLTDKPQRPDDVAKTVGLRAIQSLNKAPIAQDIQDLPKAERDDLTKAIGRTILNALTLQPEQKGQQTDLADRPEFEELKKSISSSISPSILVGLVNTELLSDRAKRDLAAISRTTAPANKSMGVPNRHTVALKQAPEKVIERPIVGEYKKKKLFDFDETETRRERSEFSFQRTDANKFVESNPRSERPTFTRRSDLVHEKNESRSFNLQ